jgi:hypothetical protein
MGFATLAYSMILQSASGYNFFLMFYLLLHSLVGMVFRGVRRKLDLVCTRFAGRRLTLCFTRVYRHRHSCHF